MTKLNEQALEAAITPKTVHYTHDVREHDTIGMVSDVYCTKCKVTPYGDQAHKLLDPCQADNTDDVAVDQFALSMKAKLKWERDERGRSGWQTMSAEDLSRLLYEHLPKGDPVDVANFCMMLSLNGQSIITAYLNALPSVDVGDLVESLIVDGETRNDYCPWAVKRQAASLIQSQAARIAELERERDGWFQATKNVLETGSLVPPTTALLNRRAEG